LIRNYQIINLILAGITGMIFLYSGIFSAERDNHPIPCYYKKATGEECRTCGFSNAFSELVRGNISKAMEHNSLAGPVFLFFLLQFLLRMGLWVFLNRKPHLGRHVLLFDIPFSVLLFFWSFRELMVFW
jgi:hypothetical protein